MSWQIHWDFVKGFIITFGELFTDNQDLTFTQCMFIHWKESSLTTKNGIPL